MLFRSIAEFLKSVESTSMVNRGYSYICDWVSTNEARFKLDGNSGELYGKIEADRSNKDEYAYIISSVFNRACESAGIITKALLSGLKTKGLIKTKANGQGYAVPQRIGSVVSSCICLKMLNEDGEMSDSELDEYPF